MRRVRRAGIPLSSLFHPRRARNGWLAISLIFPVLIAAGCWIDGTFVLRNPGKGLSQHYGYWAFFVTTPVIVLLTSHLFEKFAGIIRNVDQYCTGLTPEMTRRLDRLVERHLKSLSLHARSLWIFVFIIFVFFCWWILNVIATISPAGTYQHDVFDASAHKAGYYVAKAYLLFVFAIVYATALFVALHVTASMISILKFICKEEILSVNFFHVDNCGGTSQFGNVNLIILAMYASIAAVIFALYVTHGHTYFSMLVSLISCSVIAVAQSVVAVYFMHKAVAQKKRERIDTVTAQLNARSRISLQGERFPDDLLTYRNHLIAVRTYPYAKSAVFAVNVIRFAPGVLGAVGYFTHP